jgi:hypothetical protein
MKSKTTKPMPRRKRRSNPASDYRIIGTTSDGVKILRGKTKPTHFTSKEIRAIIDDIKQGSSPRS